MNNTILNEPDTKRFLRLAATFTILTMLLAGLHPIFAILAVVPASLIAYLFCDLISRIIFKKDFVFVSKFGLNSPEEQSKIRRSDYFLTLFCAIITVIGLFLVGEVFDRLHGTDIWKWDMLTFK